MIYKNVKNIKKDLKMTLNKDRYEHTVGVEYMAVALAMKYGANIKEAEIAGLLHDCAKCIPDERILKKCIKYNIKITDAERQNPYLLHAKLGAFYVTHKYYITDKNVISAVLNHTTGAPAMDLLDKIIFVADYIEPRRYKAVNLDEIRRIAFEDIDMAVFKILRDTLNYLEENNRDIDDLSVKAFNYYDAYIRERDNTQPKDCD